MDAEPPVVGAGPPKRREGLRGDFNRCSAERDHEAGEVTLNMRLDPLVCDHTMQVHVASGRPDRGPSRQEARRRRTRRGQGRRPEVPATQGESRRQPRPGLPDGLTSPARAQPSGRRLAAGWSGSRPLGMIPAPASGCGVDRIAAARPQSPAFGEGRRPVRGRPPATRSLFDRSRQGCPTVGS